MANWREIIISGSDADLNKLTVASSLTASGLIYPESDGSNQQVLQTDGAGNLSFVNKDSGPQGATGAQGASGTNGTNGAQGTQGIVGTQGIQGVTGIQGTDGSKGEKGIKGSDSSIVGPQGATGAQGTTGTGGSQGATGTQGTGGTQGTAGNFGGASFDYTFNSSTSVAFPGGGKVALNSGTQQSATTMSISEEDDNSNDISSIIDTVNASDSAVKGFVRIQNKSNTSDYITFPIPGSIADNGTWRSIPLGTAVGDEGVFSNDEDVIVSFVVAGDKGQKGQKGEVGDQGTQGATGIQGTDGTKGQKGEIGTQGSTGTQGAGGTQGSTGAQGIQGIVGTQGIQGVTGIQGTDGTQGDSGTDGTQGATGAKGATGAQGILGTQGDTGAKGQKGEVGEKGTTGTQGDTGAKGQKGEIGAQGTDGTNGTQGADGTNGTQGETGSKGQKGEVGAQGDTGAKGQKGEIGAQGDTGAKGQKGEVGVGTQGATGGNGPQGATGGSGPQGATGGGGTQGAQGIPGGTGPQGTDGTNGTQGIEGNKGEPGTDGTQGPSGPKGAAATINNAAANRVTTVGADTSELDAEANLLFSSRTLNLSGGGNVLIDESTLDINSGQPTWDVTSNSNHKITLTQNSVLTASNWQAGDTGVLVVQQDGTGGRTLNVMMDNNAVFLGSSVPYTASSAASATDLLGFYYDGSKYYISIGYGGSSSTGAQGATGTQGADGPQGTAGTNGTNGTDGSQGASGAELQINNDVTTLVAVLGGNGGITGSSTFKNSSTNTEMVTNTIISGSLSVGFSTNATTTRGRIDASNDVVAFSTSDKKYKENIIEIKDAIDKVNKISGVEFDWIPLSEEEKIDNHSNEGHDVGVIAQEIEKVLPEVVIERENGSKAVKYDKIVALLIQAIKEQQIQINNIKNGGPD